MASTIQAPPPAPPAPPSRRRQRSFAGPVVLILVGVCFLLSNMGIISWHNFGRWFSHYWPVLLIVWGIIKLIEYQQANRSGERPAGIGAGGVMLIVLVVIAGLTSTEAYRWNWKGLCDDMNVEGVPWCGHTYNYTDEMQQTFPTDGGSLRVTSEHGAINVTASDDNQIHVTVHKRINADRQQQADEWNKSTRPQITVNGQVLTVDANTRGGGDHWVSNDLDIAIPRKAAVVLSTRHGDVSIMGREGRADITSKDGDVSVTDLKGDLSLNLDSSSARVSQVTSDVVVQGRAKDVSLEDVKGTVRLDGDFMESVRLSRIAKAVSFKTTRTDMDFSRLDGDLNLDSGDLEARSITGPLSLSTRSKDIRIDGVSSNVQIKNENGAVEIEINKLGSVEIQNSRGDIRVSVPEKASFQLEAHARDGEIQSDFSELKIENDDKRATASGSVNGGTAHIVLNNDRGAIEIRKGAAVAAIPAPPPAPKMPKTTKTPDVPQPTEN
jgi:DUF4097 and DUF4098 domain-containing protein YvlB